MDGTYKDRYFQIGANANQNVGISIGDLTGARLGLAAVFSQPRPNDRGSFRRIRTRNFSRDDVYYFNN